MTENPCAAAQVQDKEHIVLNGGWPKIAATIIGGLFLAMITASGTAAFYLGQLTTATDALNATLLRFIETQEKVQAKNDVEHERVKERIRDLERDTFRDRD